MRYRDRNAELKWESYRNNLKKATPVPHETAAEKKKRIARLEKHPEDWFNFYFPNYATSEPAPFHKRATRRLLKNDRWYEVRAWSRELSKSTRGMMEDLYMAMTGMAKVFLMISQSYDQAEKLLMPYMINLESNDRLINDYGLQKGMRNWETGDFVTRKGCSFTGFGVKQSPRGTKQEASRPDVLRFDDIDIDERCLNETLMKNLWKKLERAFIPTVSVSGNIRIVFQNNLIHKNSIIAKASKFADHYEVINIRDKHGVSTWPQKNSEKQIDWLLSKMSYSSAQQEYFNNPITEGTTFKELVWGKVPSLRRFPFLVAYGDPAPSNKDTKGNSFKGVVLLGMLGGKLYIIKAFLRNTSNKEYIEWYHKIKKYVNDKNIIYNYMENNGFQDPFYDQVYKPLMTLVGKERDDKIFVLPDERKKPDKFTRMEGALEPLHRDGDLIFNSAEKDNKDMQTMAEQFEAVEPKLSSPADGPDAVEGGLWIIKTKVRSMGPMTNHTQVKSKNRY